MRRRKFAEKNQAVKTRGVAVAREEGAIRRGCGPATAAGADAANLFGWKNCWKDCWKKREEEEETQCDAEDQ
jgi:hypothetical protein